MNPTNENHLSKSGIFTLMFAATFTVMVGSLITPALPAISRQLGFESAPGWLVTLPALGVVLFGPATGWLIRRLGARPAMMAGLALYGLLGEAAVFLGVSRTAVLADRLLLGAATAVVMTAGTTLIADFSAGSERLKLIAWQGMAIEAGGVVFLALGGVLGELGWRMPFLLYLLSWACLLCVFLAIPRTLPDKEDQVASVGDPSSDLFPVFLRALLAMAIFFVAYITLPALLSLRLHLSESATGYFMAFISLMAVVFAGCLPVITTRISATTLLNGSFVLFGCGELLFAHATGMSGVLPGAIAMGAGFGFSIPIANHLVLERSAPKHRGRNLSYLSMAIFLGQFASSVVTLANASAQSALLWTGLSGLGFGLVTGLVAWKRQRRQSYVQSNAPSQSAR